MTQPDLWDAVPDEGRLRLLSFHLSDQRNAVHLWQVRLDLPAATLTELAATLASDELARADRFHFSRDRAHYLAGRGTLRRILGCYLNLAPAQLRFVYHARGKPGLAMDQRSVPPLEFNLSHSAGLMLVAIAAGRRVGVDIEQQRGDLPLLDLAERFFSPTERAALRVLPPELLRPAFYTCWTRKEAYIKARGEGLTLDLERFDVMIGLSEGGVLPPPHLRTPDEPAEASRWSLHDITAPADYSAALVAEGAVGVLLRFDADRAFVH